MHFEVGFRQEVTLSTTANEKLGVLVEVADFLAGVLGKVGGDWDVAGVPEFIRGFSGGDSKLRRLGVTPSGSGGPGRGSWHSPPAVVIGINFRTPESSLRSFTFLGARRPVPLLISLRRRTCPIPLGPSS